MAKLFANSGDPDQTPRSAASDLGLHCSPITLLQVSRLQWVKAVPEKETVRSRDGRSEKKNWLNIRETVFAYMYRDRSLQCGVYQFNL